MTAAIRQAKAILGAMGNPEEALKQIVSNNPAVRQAITRYGSVEGAVTALCEERGINPQEFMDALR